MERRLAAIMAVDAVGYSRLMEQDEAGTFARLAAIRRGLVEPRIAERHGRIVKLMGDGALVEFPSVVEAVDCALAIQAAMAAHGAEAGETEGSGGARAGRIEFRVGITLGDLIVEGDDLYGEGVNMAARLQEVAEPGGICVSADVMRYARGKTSAAFDDLGLTRVKNLAEPLHLFKVKMAGANGDGAAPAKAARLSQEIRFCRARDGTRIAYASVGKGPALVKAANWMNHLEFDWESPIWRHWFTELSVGHRLIRYDERANGLSDWDVADVSFDAFVDDLETVIEAAGLDRVALLGLSQGCAVSIAYAVRHPQKVSCMVLYGGYAAGWRARGNPELVAQREALSQMTRGGRGQDNPAIRQVFTTLIIPDASAEQMRWFNELERMTASPENAFRLQQTFSGIDVRPLLRQVRVPTLVLHNRHDAVVPFEAGRELATSIPDARFVPLDGRNHILLERDIEWPRFLAETHDFLRQCGGEW